MKVTVLGSGTSAGVPFIGCDCAVCRSADPHDRRTRPSILIDLGRDTAAAPFASAVRFVLVDTSTDLRAQALANDVRRVDAILFTHSHADHIFGLDDVRRFNHLQGTAIPCYADEETLFDLKRTFSYVFSPPRQKGGGVPQLSLFQIAGPFSLGGREIVPVPLFHGRLPVFGFRIGAFAYLTDCNRIPDGSWPLLAGVSTVIIDALRPRPHATHFSVAEALDAVRRIGAERAWFTHISHDLSHAESCAQLPRGVQLAYDGLVVDVVDA